MSTISQLKNEDQNKGHDAKAEHRRKEQIGEAVKKKQTRRAADGKPHRQTRNFVQSAKHSLVDAPTPYEEDLEAIAS